MEGRSRCLQNQIYSAEAKSCNNHVLRVCVCVCWLPNCDYRCDENARSAHWWKPICQHFERIDNKNGPRLTRSIPSRNQLFSISARHTHTHVFTTSSCQFFLSLFDCTAENDGFIAFFNCFCFIFTAVFSCFLIQRGPHCSTSLFSV